MSLQKLAKENTIMTQSVEFSLLPHSCKRKAFFHTIACDMLFLTAKPGKGQDADSLSPLWRQCKLHLDTLALPTAPSQTPARSSQQTDLTVCCVDATFKLIPPCLLTDGKTAQSRTVCFVAMSRAVIPKRSLCDKMFLTLPSLPLSLVELSW